MLRLTLLWFLAMRLARADLMFPYGTGATLPRIDDDCSDEISLEYIFPFFGTPQDSFYVCTNGIISFGDPVTSYAIREFPIADNPVIAPFWADVDTRTSEGNVYYREASQSDLNLLTEAVDIYGFNATWGFIVTWDQVPGFGLSSSVPPNTFQAALCLEGNVSFAIFNYEQIDWTYGSASDEVPAQVGFDAGDQSNSYAHEWSRTSDVTRLVNSSNVGFPGRFIYGIYDATIVEAEEVVVDDPCEPIDCNNGTCVAGVCNCTLGYEGTHCDVEICVTYDCGLGNCVRAGECICEAEDMQNSTTSPCYREEESTTIQQPVTTEEEDDHETTSRLPTSTSNIESTTIQQPVTTVEGDHETTSRLPTSTSNIASTTIQQSVTTAEEEEVSEERETKEKTSGTGFPLIPVVAVLVALAAAALIGLLIFGLKRRKRKVEDDEKVLNERTANSTPPTSHSDQLYGAVPQPNSV